MSTPRVDIGGGEDGRVSSSAGSGAVVPVGYAEQVKVQVRTSRVQAARAVDTALVGLYWRIRAVDPRSPGVRRVGEQARCWGVRRVARAGTPGRVTI